MGSCPGFGIGPSPWRNLTPCRVGLKIDDDESVFVYKTLSHDPERLEYDPWHWLWNLILHPKSIFSDPVYLGVRCFLKTPRGDWPKSPLADHKFLRAFSISSMLRWVAFNLRANYGEGDDGSGS